MQYGASMRGDNMHSRRRHVVKLHMLDYARSRLRTKLTYTLLQVSRRGRDN